jgi:hypothetical protein
MPPLYGVAKKDDYELTLFASMETVRCVELSYSDSTINVSYIRRSGPY